MAFGLLNDIVITQKNYKCLSTDTKPTSNIEGSATCYETDTLDLYEFDGAAWVKIRTTNNNGDPAANVVAELTNLANTLGLYTPARDILVDWLVGADDGTETLTASTEHVGLPAEIGYINPNTRSVVIQTDAAATYDYEIYFSRNIDTNADNVLVASATITAQSEVNIPLPASLGYDVYCLLKLTPAAGQTGSQLEYKSYLIGRGG